MSGERGSPELSLSELVSFERKGRLSVIKFPSEEISVVHFSEELDQIEAENEEFKIPRKQERSLSKFLETDHKKISLGDNGYILISAQAETSDLENPFYMSKGSDAKYLARYEKEGLLFLLQYLQGQTTRHSHPKPELFIPLSIYRNSFSKNSSVEVVEDTLLLPADVYHEAFSEKDDEPTLTIIVQPIGVAHNNDPAGKTPIDQLRAELASKKQEKLLASSL